jgi:hypothetical protein
LSLLAHSPCDATAAVHPPRKVRGELPISSSSSSALCVACSSFLSTSCLLGVGFMSGIDGKLRVYESFLFFLLFLSLSVVFFLLPITKSCRIMSCRVYVIFAAAGSGACLARWHWAGVSGFVVLWFSSLAFLRRTGMRGHDVMTGDFWYVGWTLLLGERTEEM